MPCPSATRCRMSVDEMSSIGSGTTRCGWRSTEPHDSEHKCGGAERSETAVNAAWSFGCCGLSRFGLASTEWLLDEVPTQSGSGCGERATNDEEFDAAGLIDTDDDTVVVLDRASE